MKTFECDLDLREGNGPPNEITVEWDIDSDFLTVDIYGDVAQTVCLNAEHANQLGKELIRLSKEMKKPRP